MAIIAAKAAVLIVILDALRVTRNSSWFEEYVARRRASALLCVHIATGTQYAPS